MRQRSSVSDTPGTIVLAGMDAVPGRRLQEAFADHGWACKTADTTFDTALALQEIGPNGRLALLMHINRLGMQSCINIAKHLGAHPELRRTLLIGIHNGDLGTAFDETVFDDVYHLPFDPALCALRLQSLQPDNMRDFPPEGETDDTN